MVVLFVGEIEVVVVGEFEVGNWYCVDTNAESLSENPATIHPSSLSSCSSASSGAHPPRDAEGIRNIAVGESEAAACC